MDVGGVAVRTLQAGPADASEAVVLVHGNPGSADDWEALLGALPEGLRGLSLDLPDFGERHADRHGDPARLPLAPARAHLAHAGARRAVPGNRDARGVSHAPQPQRATRPPARVRRPDVRPPAAPAAPSFAERQRDAFPSAEVHVLAGSGHWPFADAPETVQRLLVEFLGRVRDAA